MKTCSKCGCEKPVESFPKGYGRVCKACRMIQMKAWKKANPEKVAASNHQSYMTFKSKPHFAELRRRYNTNWVRKNRDRRRGQLIARIRRVSDGYARYLLGWNAPPEIITLKRLNLLLKRKLGKTKLNEIHQRNCRNPKQSD